MGKSLFIAFVLLTVAGGARAQRDSLLLTDYDFVENQDRWLSCENAAGLTRLGSVCQLSDARLSLSHEWGELCDYDMAPKATALGAWVASYFRLNPQTVLYGSITYDNFTGRDMGGSAFMHLSSRYPFDIVEDSLTNHGKKHRDVYHLTGAFGTALTRRLALGLKADYVAANYAKYKDLRHKNTLMDLTLTAGLYATLGRVQVGADFYYRRNTESLRFATYGTGDKVYKSLIDYAAMMGQVEAFGENGYTSKNREMPLLSEYVGAGVQLGGDITRTLYWFSELTYRHRYGYYGKKSPYSITYNEHRSSSYSYRSCLRLSLPRAKHSLDILLTSENLEDLGNSYREATDDNSATYYEYFAPVKMSNKLWITANMSYRVAWDIRHLLPTWQLTADFTNDRHRQTGYVYPYYRRQNLTTRRISASLLRNILLRSAKGRLQGKNSSFLLPPSSFLLSLQCSLHYQWGSGNPFTDGTLAAPSDLQIPPPTMEAYLFRHYEFVTARQWGAEVSLRYSWAPQTLHLKPYTEVSYSFRKCADIEWLEGDSRGQLLFSIGTSF